MKPKIELPPKYYLAHFHEFLRGLTERAGDCFLEEHREFVARFQELSEDSRCLFVRLINRKGRFFFIDDLTYAEINREAALEELKAKGFIRAPRDEDWSQLLEVLSRKHLVQLMLEMNVVMKKSAGSDEVRAQAALHLPSMPPVLLERLIVQEFEAELEYLLYLSFGEIEQGVTLYALRDLGIKKTNSYEGLLKPRFTSKQEALSHYFYAHHLHHRTPVLPPPEEWPSYPLDLRERLLLRLVSETEDTALALGLLRRCQLAEGRERLARLLHQCGERDECLGLLHQMIDAPVSDEECLFAQDFLLRKYERKKVSVLTEALRSAREISLDEAHYRQPEAGVVEYLAGQGKKAWHCENHLWCVLFAMLFHEEIYLSGQNGFHDEFDRLPSELFNGQFSLVHATAIAEKLMRFQERAAWMELLLRWEAGKPESFINWYEDTAEILREFLGATEITALMKTLEYLAGDFGSRSSGFPDVLAMEEGQVIFYEVKAEGDTLRKNQLLQFQKLRSFGFRVDILRVRYRYNPEQTYVVVDLETTGVRPGVHRITEIGAVKVRGGKILETFQTLVNPERSIPRFIRELTGITNEMVKEAPKFSEVSQALEEFTKGAIFVAHNVNFDYKFVQAEFERLEQKFVRPFTCTRAGMKKHYPGRSSYSLGELTRSFEIPLVSHHRALCDAEAAAQLLLLIHQKRSLEELQEA